MVGSGCGVVDRKELSGYVKCMMGGEVCVFVGVMLLYLARRRGVVVRGRG